MVRPQGGYILRVPDIEICVQTEEDFDEVWELVNCGYKKRTRESMEWSMKKSPIFSIEHSLLAKVDGKTVGCWLTTIQDLRIAPDLDVKSASGLVVVHPGFRRLGIGRTLWNYWGRRGSEDQLLGFGVSSRETRRAFWSKLSTSPVLPDRATVYTKTLNTGPIERAVSSLANDRGSNNSPLRVKMELVGYPPFTVNVWPGNISMCEGREHDMKIEGTLDSTSLRSLFFAILSRRIRIRGVRHLIRLFRSRGILFRFAKSLKSSQYG